MLDAFLILASMPLLLLSLAGVVLAFAAVQFFLIALRRNWRRKVPAGRLAAYVQQVSVNQGEPVQVCIHAEVPARAELFRLGARIEQVDWSAEVPHQVQPLSYDFWHGYLWTTTVAIDSRQLPPGVYLLHLAATDDRTLQHRLAFIVRAAKPVPIAVIASTNTWQAYNHFAGLSNYVDTATPQPLRLVLTVARHLNLHWRIGAKCVPAVPLPLARPNVGLDIDLADIEAFETAPLSHLVRGEWSLLRFLEAHGVSYGVFSDEDLAFGEAATRAKLMVFNTHSEYWSEEMIGRLGQYLRGGGKVAFLSGNNIYRKVEFQQGRLAVVDQMTAPSMVSRLIGAAYSDLGYHSYAGYRVTSPEHWVFAGTNAVMGTRFGETGTEVPGMPDQRIGASGWETDKLTQWSDGFELLAIGENAEGPAAMVFRDTSSGGWVFNAASVSFTRLIGVDPVIDRLVLNLVANAAAPDDAALEHSRM
jgi:N,N-dimethylformamidase